VLRGDFLGVRHDPAQPQRRPAPRPDLRLRNVPLGPVAVFGASNFPLAFSVAGGDTAAALAAGCPVVVKAHSAHPGTAELVGRALQAASIKCNMPRGTFSMLHGSGRIVGHKLVTDRRIKAAAFTGSRVGGGALMELAAKRPEPIPVYAEMSSLNPVILFPHALRTRGEQIAQAFVTSLLMGVGQFCTSPGILFAVNGPDLAAFLGHARSILEGQRAGTMLSRSIVSAYRAGVQRLMESDAACHVAQGLPASGPCGGQAHLFTTSLDAFITQPLLREEVFGSSSIVVQCPDVKSILEAMKTLEGQLTAGLHFDDDDTADVRPFIGVLETKVGRILANGFGTGVEVTHAMVHGGGFPSTSDGRSTSVGSLAINRFLRPVSYQDLPDSVLAPELRDANPWNLSRRIDGRLYSNP